MSVLYLSREEWGADPSLPRLGHAVNGASTFRGVVVHHTVFVLSDYDGDGFVAGDLDDIRRYMQELQKIRPDLGLDVPYSFVAFEGVGMYDAIVCEGRGLGRTGAHTKGFNSSRLGVAIAGNTSQRPVTPGVISAIRWCGSLLHDQESLHDTLGHRAFKATECPGLSMQAAMPRVQPPFLPVPTPDEEDDMLTLIDLNDNAGWVVTGTKARKLNNVEGWLDAWTGPVRKARYMADVVEDLYEVVN